MVFLGSLPSRLLLWGWVSFPQRFRFRSSAGFVFRGKFWQAVLMVLLFEDVIAGFWVFFMKGTECYVDAVLRC